MPNTFIKLSTITVGASGAASIDFTNIPQTFTDLLLKFSVRGDNTGSVGNLYVLGAFNGVTTNRTFRRVSGNGSSVQSDNGSLAQFGVVTNATHTASIFSNSEVYIPNYTSSNNKPYSLDTTAENNGAATEVALFTGLWSSSAAITQITLTPSANNFVQYSTATLYGILKA